MRICGAKTEEIRLETFGPTFALANQFLANDTGKMNIRFILISEG